MEPPPPARSAALTLFTPSMAPTRFTRSRRSMVSTGVLSSGPHVQRRRIVHEAVQAAEGAPRLAATRRPASSCTSPSSTRAPSATARRAMPSPVLGRARHDHHPLVQPSHAASS
jgi:hypothetical protein